MTQENDVGTRPRSCAVKRAALVVALAGAGAWSDVGWAASAAAPTLSGARISVGGTMANVEARGEPGTSTGGNLGVSFGKFGLNASGNQSSNALGADAVAGALVIEGAAKLRNSEVNVQGTMANSLSRGGSLRSGVATIGPAAQ